MEEERGIKGGSSNPRHRYHLGARAHTFFISYEIFGNDKKTTKYLYNLQKRPQPIKIEKIQIFLSFLIAIASTDF